ncbi:MULTISPECIES: LLM class flavin-dependent oxidoreductase [unclassified Nocardioides]|uniref:LLM class flavin-dependent oxidoreductase n=1 Tax=unclassified Nocardioides TaxID=2615069 RepID=UPI0000570DCD|nr:MULTISPECIES: LLM class flavin-dependent oxidoreductase [unclassified Nocardioides]ABL82877.1 FAD linked oxidase domain protein [Nocardioides sp. JS614]
MTNYGHRIGFGVEVTGAGEAPEDAVALAVLVEDLGYDLVTFPDRGGADASTLAAWAAARTSRAQVAASRLDATARPASIVARGAGSLQLLSGGRALLLLGSESAAANLDALEEAVAVVRSLLDTSRPRVSSAGTRHRLADAEPGPGLELAVPLWLHGSDSTAAALAGRLADGWVVDLDEVGVEGLAALSAVLDRAAVDAGRDVREVRRSVALAPGDLPDADALTALVVDHGVSSVLLRVGTEDEPLLRTFIDTVAPAVRDGAERALPPGALSSRQVRRADVRARRRPDISYDDVPDELAETAVEPGDAAFAKVRSTYLRGGNPGLVLRPRTAAAVASAVGFARVHRHLPLGIRSGGHGISGRSTNDGGLVIDVGALDDVTVLDEAARLVRIGPGARWRDVATALQPHGWALSSGDYGGVGVGGLATAGGIGFLSRKHGLTIDHLRAVEMVLADGSLVRASATENAELFWAVRGAGANFGIAVAFEFVVDEVAEVGWAQLAFQAPDPAAYLEGFARVVAETPRETTPFLILGQGVAQVMAMVDSADPEVIVGQLQPFAEIAPLVQQQVVIAPYAAVMNMFPETPHNGYGEPVSRSAFTREITPAFASASADLIRSGASHWYQIRTVGGAVADVAPDATAYAHRDANFALAVMGGNAQRLDRWFEPVRRHSDGLYLSFESDRHPDRIADAFPPATLDRLRRLKAEVDPHNLFQDNFNIAPTHDTRTAS